MAESALCRLEAVLSFALFVACSIAIRIGGALTTAAPKYHVSLVEIPFGVRSVKRNVWDSLCKVARLTDAAILTVYYKLAPLLLHNLAAHAL